MAEDPSRGADDDVPDDIDRLVRRLDAHRSLPAMEPAKIPVLGLPSAVADEARAAWDAQADIVVMPARIYVTLELPGASRETLEVTTTDARLTIHAVGADGRVFHREIGLPHPVEPEAVTATYRNGVLDVDLPRRRGHRIRLKRGD